MAETNSEEKTPVWKTRKTAWLGNYSGTKRFTMIVDPLSVIGEEELTKAMDDIQNKASACGHDVGAGWTATDQAAGLACARCRQGTLLRVVDKKLEVRGKFYERSCRR